MFEGRSDDPRDAERQFAQRLHDAHADRALFLQSRPNPGALNGPGGLVALGPLRSGCGWSDRATNSPAIFPRTGRPGRQRVRDDQHGRRSVCRAGGHQPHGLEHSRRQRSPISRSALERRTTTLPAPWTSRDLGSPALAGSASAAGGTFTVAAGGIDIWGTSDQFHFVYQPLQGDVEVIARIASLQVRRSAGRRQAS